VAEIQHQTAVENAMNSRHMLGRLMPAVLAIVLVTANAFAQEKSLREQLTGVWTLVSNDSVAPDGSKRQLYGPNPKGVLVLAANGQYVQISVRPDLPNFKINNRLAGTPEENKAALAGTVAYFGTWSVDVASKTLIVHIDGSLFPNQVGTNSKRAISLSGDKLTVINPAPGSVGRAVNVFRRAK
jgi:Lipocalin-like domain